MVNGVFKLCLDMGSSGIDFFGGDWWWRSRFYGGSDGGSIVRGSRWVCVVRFY